jgi:hypothetical protein
MAHVAIDRYCAIFDANRECDIDVILVIMPLYLRMIGDRNLDAIRKNSTSETDPWHET